jgi:hypothetical protein
MMAVPLDELHHSHEVDEPDVDEPRAGFQALGWPSTIAESYLA